MFRSWVSENKVFSLLLLILVLVGALAFSLYSNAFLTYDGLAYQHEFLILSRSCFVGEGWETYSYKFLTCIFLKATGSLYSIQLLHFIIMVLTLLTCYFELSKYMKKSVIAAVMIVPFIIYPIYIFNTLLTERDVLSALFIQMGIVTLYSLIRQDKVKKYRVFLPIGIFTLAALIRVENTFYVFWTFIVMLFFLGGSRRKALTSLIISLAICFTLNHLAPRFFMDEGVYSIKHKSFALVLLHPLTHIMINNRDQISKDDVEVIEKITDSAYLLGKERSDVNSFSVEVTQKIKNYSMLQWWNLCRLTLRLIIKNPKDFLDYQKTKFIIATTNELKPEQITVLNNEIVDATFEQSKLRKAMGYIPLSRSDKSLIGIYEIVKSAPIFNLFKVKTAVLLLFYVLLVLMIQLKLGETLALVPVALNFIFIFFIVPVPQIRYYLFLSFFLPFYLCLAIHETRNLYHRYKLKND